MCLIRNLHFFSWLILGALERQERSHAAWRSFFSKKLIPMLRGARSGPRGWRQLPARSAPMLRGARFFQKQCFPCCVALVLGRGGAGRSAPMQRDKTIHQTNKQPNKEKNTKTAPKKKPYIKNYATPDRPPPAAVMLF